MRGCLGEEFAMVREQHLKSRKIVTMLNSALQHARKRGEYTQCAQSEQIKYGLKGLLVNAPRENHVRF